MIHLDHNFKTSTKRDWRGELHRLEGAYAPSTMKSYRVNVEIFVSWCEQRQFTAFPASEETISGFLEDQSLTCSISTIRQRLYAIRKFRRLLELEDATDTEAINLVLRRIRRRKTVRPKQAKALNHNHRDRFLAAQPNTPWGLRDKAIIALGYDILARRSELVALRTSDIVFRKDGTTRVTIRWSKSDQFGSGRIAFTSRTTATLLTDWLSWRGDASDYLFCPIHQFLPLDRGLNPTTIKRVIKKAAKNADFSKADVAAFSGHSMRVGAAQDLLCAGHEAIAIMRAGGWKSTNVLARYLEHAEQNVWT